MFIRKAVVKPAPTTLTGRYFWGGAKYTLNGILQYTLYFTAKN